MLASAGFGTTFGARIAELVPPGHLLRSEEVPVEDLAVAVLDPVRDPERYGGALEHVEARWHQLGAWVADLGMPPDACHHLVRALARTARDVSGEEWDSAASSGWAALQMWMQAHLDAGAAEVHGPAPAVTAPAAPADSYPQGYPHPGTSSGSPPDGTAQDAAPAAAPAEAPHPEEPAPAPPAGKRGRPGRRPAADQLAAIWSSRGDSAMSMGGAPPEALRAMRRALGDHSADGDEAPGGGAR